MVKRLLMMQWVSGSIPHGGPIELFLDQASSPHVTTGVTKTVVCAILSVGWCI